MLDQTRAWAEFSREALINNLERTRKDSVASVMAVIKANAYGHGMKFVAETLLPYADAFAVATLEEAVALRSIAEDKEITCLSGFNDAGQIKTLESHLISPVIFNTEQVKWLKAHGKLNLSVWVKIDSGMHRLGIRPSELEHAISELQTIGCHVSVMSHFASADTPESGQNSAQHQVFKQAVESIFLRKSFCNSAALLTRQQDHYDVIRPGIMLYGSSPFADQSAQALGLLPVMRLHARLLDLKTLNAGDTVGYSASWTAEKRCIIGTVSMGYADGYPRVISNDAQLAINGKRFSIIGRVSMDTLAVKLDESSDFNIGDPVELWGKTISVDEVARWANTISYELLCKVTNRVQKVII